jgi:hypothetical protein
VSVFDFTDSARPVEIAFFDRGPIDGTKLITGGYWSTYWYNGVIYASEIARGLDVFKLTPSPQLSQHEIAAATLVHSRDFNPQAQTRTTWPATSLVARAYLDQLSRTKGLAPDSAEMISRALERADSGRSGSRQDASAGGMEQLASGLERSADTANAVDAGHLRALSAILKTYAGRAQ